MNVREAIDKVSIPYMYHLVGNVSGVLSEVYHETEGVGMSKAHVITALPVLVDVALDLFCYYEG